MDEESRATVGAWAVLSQILAGVVAEQRGVVNGEPQRLAELARAAGRDANAVVAGWRMSRYRADELATWIKLTTPHPRVALTEIDRHGRQWWDSLTAEARPSLADWKIGAHDLVVLTAPDDRAVEDATLAWLDLTWTADRHLWVEDPEHPINGKPVAELADDRVPILASAAAAAWLGTVLPNAEEISTDLQQRTAQFAEVLVDLA